jgi:hypothetical protein
MLAEDNLSDDSFQELHYQSLIFRLHLYIFFHRMIQGRRVHNLVCCK